MRLRSVWISKFKNIEDLLVEFNGESFLEIFIGRNGSGKSNFLEAIVKIFYGIYSAIDGRNEFEFECLISYELDGVDIKFEYRNSSYYVNGRELSDLSSVPVPDRILVYYSGHNPQIARALDRYNEEFFVKCRKPDATELRRFFGISENYKSLLFSVLLIQKNETKARIYISEKLSINNTPSEFIVSLQRPQYALNKYGKRLANYDVESNDGDGAFWKLKGESKAFLDRLMNCVTKNSDLLRTEGYQWEDDKYKFYFDIEKIREEFSDFSAEDMFISFDKLNSIGMLESIVMPISTEGNENSSLASLSDGQLQSVYIYAISELFKNSNCLTLMDEPDSFLHPEWQHECLRQIKDVSDEAAQSNHILMSSHSAITLIEYPGNKVRYFDIKNGRTKCNILPKRIAISKLSANILNYSEQDRILSIIHTIQIENKPVLFTEGSTDPLIIKEAWYKLYDQEMPFIPFYAFSCTYINQLLTDDRIHSEMKGLPVFALFDFDKAFNSWNGLNGDTIEHDPFKGMVKKWANGDSFAIMIPVPDNVDIKAQTFRNESTLETYGDRSHCEIEHLFYGFEETKGYYTEESIPGGRILSFKNDGLKSKFAREVVPNLPKYCFSAFKPMLEFIKNKCEEYKSKFDKE